MGFEPFWYHFWRLGIFDVFVWKIMFLMWEKNRHQSFVFLSTIFLFIFDGSTKCKLVNLIFESKKNQKSKNGIKMAQNPLFKELWQMFVKSDFLVYFSSSQIGPIILSIFSTLLADNVCLEPWEGSKLTKIHNFESLANPLKILGSIKYKIFFPIFPNIWE